jgi:hypothetical protein
MKYRPWPRAVFRWFAALLTIGAAMLVSPAMSSVASAAPRHHQNVTNVAKGAVTVCKVANDPSLQGTSFPFLEGSWSGSFRDSFSLVAAKSPGNCATTKQWFPAGTAIGVEEASSPGVVPPGVNATFALAGAGKLAAVVPSIDFAVFIVGAGYNVLTVTDTPKPPPGIGSLEVCKLPRDRFVGGSFGFQITGAGGFSSAQTVPTSQCNDVTVPSGTLHVAEAVRFPYATSDIAADPPSALVDKNVYQQTADVNVVPGGTTTVFFTNSTLTGYVKVCKNLDRSIDNVLAGQTFDFTVSASFNGSPITGIPTSVAVTATPFGSTTCSFLTNRGRLVALPLGSLVTVKETGLNGGPLPAWVKPVATSVSPSNLDAGSTPTTAQLYVGNLPAPNNIGNFGNGSITQATFTDEAFGYVEVCKTSSSINQGTPVSFSVGGVGSIGVSVGTCSPSFLLPIGKTTVTETPLAHTTLTSVGSTAGSSWSLGSNMATVTVPFGSVANENLVTFDNEVNTSTFKLCKQQTSSDANLQNVTFAFSWSYAANGVTRSGTAALKPGQCSLPISGVPVVNSDLSAVHISVTEQTTTVADVAVTEVQVAGGATVLSPVVTPHNVSSGQGGTPATEVLSNAEGITTVTYVNGRTIG